MIARGLSYLCLWNKSKAILLNNAVTRICQNSASFGSHRHVTTTTRATFYQIQSHKLTSAKLCDGRSLRQFSSLTRCMENGKSFCISQRKGIISTTNYFSCASQIFMKKTGFINRVNGQYVMTMGSLVVKRGMKSKTPFEINSNVSQDVLLFRYDNDRLYKVLGIFGVVQFIFWMYLAHFSYSNLVDVKSVDTATKVDEESLPWWKKINLGKNMYRNGITSMCLAVGYICLAISIIYPMRTIHQLFLLKGGKSVMIETYAFAARKRTVTAPVEHVTCLHSRIGKENQIAMKIKDHYLFYLIDKAGKFTNTQLYDYVVGIKRVW